MVSLEITLGSIWTHNLLCSSLAAVFNQPIVNEMMIRRVFSVFGLPPPPLLCSKRQTASRTDGSGIWRKWPKTTAAFVVEMGRTKEGGAKKWVCYVRAPCGTRSSKNPPQKKSAGWGGRRAITFGEKLYWTSPPQSNILSRTTPESGEGVERGEKERHLHKLSNKGGRPSRRVYKRASCQVPSADCRFC